MKHIVMWKLKEQAEGKSKQENAVLMKQMLESLKDKIPEIVSLEIGIEIGNSANYDIVLISEFENKEDLQKYMNHPEHVKVSEFVSKVKEERKAVDFS